MIRSSGWCDFLRFAEVPASRLAVLRVLVSGYTLVLLLYQRQGLVAMASTDSTRFSPVGIARLLSQPLSPEIFHDIIIATVVANVLFLFGYLHRASGPMFVVLYWIVICYRNSWSMIYHSHNVLLFHVLILGVTRSADFLSIDAWLNKPWHARQRKRQAHIITTDRWHFGWAVWLMCAVTTCTYALAGIAKVAGPSGWDWALGETLRDHIAVDAIRKEVLGHSATKLSFQLYDQTWLFSVLGIGCLIVELFAPLSLFNRRLGMVWAVVTWLMHWGIFFVMGITFRYYLCGILFASFFPVEKLVPRTWARHWEN